MVHRPEIVDFSRPVCVREPVGNLRGNVQHALD
jgi:hypothetical protein